MDVPPDTELEEKGKRDGTDGLPLPAVSVRGTVGAFTGRVALGAPRAP